MVVTLDDVAKRAQVSAKTVSRVVNGEKDVSEETRQRVLQIIDEMEYVPHIQAQRLASGKTHSIALHYPLSNPGLFNERLEMSFIKGVAMGAAAENYYFTLFTGELTPRELKKILHGNIADGLILMEVALNDWRVDMLKEAQYPFVMIGHCQDNTGLSYIDFDFESAVMGIYAYLVELGHTRIGFLGYPESWMTIGLGPAMRAHQGFEQATRHFSLEPFYCNNDLTTESGAANARRMIQDHPQLTAFVAVHNTIAVGLIKVIQGMGRQIPKDYSIVGMALGRESDLIIPPLTAVPSEGDQIGQQAAQILIQKLNSRVQSVKQILVSPKIEVRGSTARLEKNSPTP